MANAGVWNDVLPHSFPPMKPTPKDHGPISEFEYYNLPFKSHTEFPAPDLDLSESSGDSIPLRQPKPLTQLQQTLKAFPDPALCITPDKPQELRAGSKISFRDDQPQVLSRYPEIPVSLRPDPSLCITPDKSTPQRGGLKQCGNIESKNKNKMKVRFDVESSEDDCNNSSNKENSSLFLSRTPGSPSAFKPYSPNDYSDNFSELSSITEPKTVIQSDATEPNTAKYRLHVTTNQTVYKPLKNTVDIAAGEAVSSQDMLPKDIYANLETIKLSSQKQSSQLKESVQKQSDQHKATGAIPKRKVFVKKESKGHPKQFNYDFPFGAVRETANSEDNEHVFARPEFNKTLKMGEKLKSLKESEIDEVKALRKKLELSESKRNEIIEKASMKVNTDADAYSGLVSLELPVEDIKHQREMQKTARVKPVKQSVKPKVGHENEPDLMEFFTSNFQKETADFSLPSSNISSELLQTASHKTAFDLYRHNAMWDKTRLRSKIIPKSQR